MRLHPPDVDRSRVARRARAAGACPGRRTFCAQARQPAQLAVARPGRRDGDDAEVADANRALGRKAFFPVARDVDAPADPDAIVLLDVVEKTLQRTEPARAPEQP